MSCGFVDMNHMRYVLEYTRTVNFFLFFKNEHINVANLHILKHSAIFLNFYKIHSSALKPQGLLDKEENIKFY